MSKSDLHSPGNALIEFSDPPSEDSLLPQVSWEVASITVELKNNPFRWAEVKLTPGAYNRVIRGLAPFNAGEWRITQRGTRDRTVEPRRWLMYVGPVNGGPNVAENSVDCPHCRSKAGEPCMIRFYNTRTEDRAPTHRRRWELYEEACK